MCCSLWGDKELDMTERLNNNKEDLLCEVKGMSFGFFFFNIYLFSCARS